MHLFQILIITKQVEVFIPLKHTDDKITKSLTILLIMTPLFILLSSTIKKKELETLDYPEHTIRIGNILLVSYIILTIAVLFGLMILIPKK